MNLNHFDRSYDRNSLGRRSRVPPPPLQAPPPPGKLNIVESPGKINIADYNHVSQALGRLQVTIFPIIILLSFILLFKKNYFLNKKDG